MINTVKKVSGDLSCWKFIRKQQLCRLWLSEAKPNNLIGRDRKIIDARRQVTSERCDFLLYSKGEQGIWQRRFREHQIRNEIYFTRHVEYIHFNPVKHGLAKSPVVLPYSSFHRYVKQGTYDSDWGAGTEIKFDVKVGHE